MSPLGLVLVIATFVAFSIGLTVKGLWSIKLRLCVIVAIVGWVLRALVILNGDATLAGDYFNGLNVGTAAIEMAVALAWTVLWCFLGILAAQVVGTRKPNAR